MSRALWKLNELEYFEAPGVSLLVFHNRPYGRKQSGLEIIQHGERIATNGGLRLPDSARCEAHREVDRARGQVSVTLRYPRSEVEGVLHLHPEGRSLRVTLDLARPIPEKVAGRAAFEILLFPVPYFGATYHLGEIHGILARQGNGTTYRAAEGNRLNAAPRAQLG